MKETVDPKSYGLPPRTVLMKMGPGKFILVINRKSRIIMKDALIILKKRENAIPEKYKNKFTFLESNQKTSIYYFQKE